MGKINMATATINTLLDFVQRAFNANKLQVQYGGTGVTNYNALRNELGLGDNIESPLPVICGGTGARTLDELKGQILSGGSGVIPVTQGGTGRSTLTDKAVLLGNGDNSVTMLTPSQGTGVLVVKASNTSPTFEQKLPKALGGTGVTSMSELSNWLGLGTATSENDYSASYNPIGVTRGGTGVSSYGDLNIKLGLATATNGNIAEGAQVSNAISIQRGGTGATNVSTARANLGAVSKTGDSLENDYVLNGNLSIKNTNASPVISQYNVTSRFKTIEDTLSPLTNLPSSISTINDTISQLQTNLNALERRVNTLEANNAH